MHLAACTVAAIALLSSSACRGGGSTNLELTVRNAFDERSYTLFCDPNGGSHPNSDAACLTLDRRYHLMLLDPDPRATCLGGPGTPHLHVAGRFRERKVDVRPDSCNGNADGERLWMKDLPGRLRPWHR